MDNFGIFSWVDNFTQRIKLFLIQIAFHVKLIYNYPLIMAMVSLLIVIPANVHAFEVKTFELSVRVGIFLGFSLDSFVIFRAFAMEVAKRLFS